MEATDITTITASDIAEIVASIATDVECEWDNEFSGEWKFDSDDTGIEGIEIEFRNVWSEDGFEGVKFDVSDAAGDGFASGWVATDADSIDVEFDR